MSPALKIIHRRDVMTTWLKNLLKLAKSCGELSTALNSRTVKADYKFCGTNTKTKVSSEKHFMKCSNKCYYAELISSLSQTFYHSLVTTSFGHLDPIE